MRHGVLRSLAPLWLALVLVGLMGCGKDVAEPDVEATPQGTRGPGGTLGITTTSANAPTTTNPTPAATVATGLLHRFPVDPPTVTSYGPGHHDYPATDIFCPVGSSFVAVTDGTVDFVSTVDTWDPATDDPVVRGGLSVAIVGDDGVRYYGSHLSAIGPGVVVGVRVTAGQTLGSTGNSGNARNTDPHLHFGVSRPTTADDWAVRRGEVDTYPLLLAWERGENVIPTIPAS